METGFPLDSSTSNDFNFPFQSLNNCELLNVFWGERLDYPKYASKIFDPFCDTGDNFSPDSHVSSHVARVINSSLYHESGNIPTVRNGTELVCHFMNIRSISSNLNEFLVESEFVANEIDFMCFAETRLSTDIECLHKLNNYNLFANSRNVTRICLLLGVFIGLHLPMCCGFVVSWKRCWYTSESLDLVLIW